MTKIKRIAVLTGTRADYGKLKSIMQALETHSNFELYIFATGMHMHKEYGFTFMEIVKDGYKNIFSFINQRHGMGTQMDLILANTINGFSAYICEINPDLIIVHGDRVEALAATIVGAMNNILVGHIEGGEISGTIDESIRHAITKLAHIHFVANEDSQKRILQLGETQTRIHIIGSPDIDVMLSPNLPTWEQVKARYEVPFDDFGVALFHPVTTSYANMGKYAKIFVDALLRSQKNYIVIHPNNDLGREFIIEEYSRLAENGKFRLIVSVRFEFFLTMLKCSQFVIGNSSVGIREAPIFAKPAIDIGDRQRNRYLPDDKIVNCDYDSEQIIAAINSTKNVNFTPYSDFGKGDSTEKFMKILADGNFWDTTLQKHFVDKD
ncbi:MAG: UDP-N-acetylglucosamine 2-epimerase [Defluviitaleaceae bacterium]|nr:UDP-N-acetylglucosamine 2-epimerase [Defluviitaleaceae bacterium]